VGGKPEEGLSLIENEGSLEVEKDDLGRGPESFVVGVGVVEEGMGHGRQLGVVDDACAVGSGVDHWRGVDRWVVQKKVSE